MKIERNHLLGCIFLAFSITGCASTQSFTGDWDWNNSPSTRTFSIELKQQGNELNGQYCAVAQNGNKTDCDDEKNQNVNGIIDADGQSATVNFSSFFGAQRGKAQLNLHDGHLFWHITKNPDDGEFYAPKDAVLDRHEPKER